MGVDRGGGAGGVGSFRDVWDSSEDGRDSPIPSSRLAVCFWSLLRPLLRLRLLLLLSLSFPIRDLKFAIRNRVPLYIANEYDNQAKKITKKTAVQISWSRVFMRVSPSQPFISLSFTPSFIRSFLDFDYSHRCVRVSYFVFGKSTTVMCPMSRHQLFIVKRERLSHWSMGSRDRVSLFNIMSSSVLGWNWFLLNSPPPPPRLLIAPTPIWNENLSNSFYSLAPTPPPQKKHFKKRIAKKKAKKIRNESAKRRNGEERMRE